MIDIEVCIVVQSVYEREGANVNAFKTFQRYMF